MIQLDNYGQPDKRQLCLPFEADKSFRTVYNIAPGEPYGSPYINSELVKYIGAE